MWYWQEPYNIYEINYDGAKYVYIWTCHTDDRPRRWHLSQWAKYVNAAVSNHYNTEETPHKYTKMAILIYKYAVYSFQPDYIMHLWI